MRKLLTNKVLMISLLFSTTITATAAETANEDKEKAIEIFERINTLAFYTGSTSVYQSDIGFYENCLAMLGANGVQGENKFVHCEWLRPEFITEPPMSRNSDQKKNWLELLQKHSANLVKVHNELKVKAGAYMEELSLEKIIKNHVERMLFNYDALPWEYCENTFWSEAAGYFSQLPRPVQKLIT